MHPVRAVLFDLDDTLFDHSHAMSQALAALKADEPAFAAWTAEYLEARHGEVLEVLHQDVLAGRLSIDDAREERERHDVVQACACHWSVTLPVSSRLRDGAHARTPLCSMSGIASVVQ